MKKNYKVTCLDPLYSTLLEIQEESFPCTGGDVNICPNADIAEYIDFFISRNFN